MLVETDCPYLAPVPMRGKRNQPDWVRFTGETAAYCLGIDTEEFAEITKENTKKAFRFR